MACDRPGTSPVTLPQDHTLFVILGRRDETSWAAKTEFLRGRGGIAMINTHPDYGAWSGRRLTKREWSSIGAEAGDALWPGPAAGGKPSAIVIGGDYQGLGIVRSLGRRGVDVVVIDDERSISRYSRYVRSAFRFRDLRDDGATMRVLLDLGRSRAFDGWVVYPTREETVATLSCHRAQLGEYFRIPAPGWAVTKWA